jgi:hypothetical protein
MASQAAAQSLNAMISIMRYLVPGQGDCNVSA